MDSISNSGQPTFISHHLFSLGSVLQVVGERERSSKKSLRIHLDPSPSPNSHCRDWHLNRKNPRWKNRWAWETLARGRERSCGSHPTLSPPLESPSQLAYRSWEPLGSSLISAVIKAPRISSKKLIRLRRRAFEEAKKVRQVQEEESRQAREEGERRRRDRDRDQRHPHRDRYREKIPEGYGLS